MLEMLLGLSSCIGMTELVLQVLELDFFLKFIIFGDLWGTFEVSIGNY